MSMTEETSLSGPFTEAALQYLAAGFSPIPVVGKHPVPQGSTGREGVVDSSKVDAWLSDPEWAGQNVALRLVNEIGIDVDDYGDKHGAKQLQELEDALGPLPATPSSTSRGEGESRIHFFEVPEGMEFIGKASPDIDIIQRSHRFAVVWPSYHPVTGSQYEWYDADGDPFFEGDIPSPSDFERLPEAWLEFLDKNNQRSAKRSTAGSPIQHDGFGGTIGEWLEGLREGAPTPKVRRWIESIPSDGFSHDDVVRITANLVHLGAEGHAGISQALDALWSAWVKPPFDDPDHIRELTVAVQGAVRKFGAQRPSPENLPTFVQAQKLLPNPLPAELQRLIFEGDDLVELLDALAPVGLDQRDMAAIAWRSPASKKYREDFALFWDTLTSHVVPLEVSPGEAPRSDASGIRFNLISDEERSRVATADNWVTRYLDWARKMVPDGYLNEPYHKAAAWVAASMIYGQIARIKNASGAKNCNLWFFTIGESSTGKNVAYDLLMMLLEAYFGTREFNLGAAGSSVGMHRQLHTRDGETSLLSSDEIAGSLKKWIDSDDRAWGDMADVLTSWYEGKVPPLQRANGGEENQKNSRANLSAILLGTPDRLLPVLTTEAFSMGFLARALFAVGEPPKDDVPWDFDEGDDEDLDDSMIPTSVLAWAQQLRADVHDMKNDGAVRLIRTTPEAKARMKQAGTKVIRLFKNHTHKVALEPSSRRLMDSVRKACALLAITNNRDEVSVDDVIYVLSHAEHWLRDAEWVAVQTSATPHRRLMNQALRSMRSMRRTDISIGHISQSLGLRLIEIKQVMDSLIAEEMVTAHEEGDRIFYRLTKRPEEGEQ